jgi:methionyl-tRNA formyltransferase
MTPAFDDGPIVGQRRYAIDPDDSMHDCYLRLLEEGPKLAVDVIDDVREGDVETRPNDPSEGEYYSLPSRADREEFLRRGNEFV